MEPVGALSGIPRTRFPAAYFPSMSVFSKQSLWFSIQKDLARSYPFELLEEIFRNSRQLIHPFLL